MNRNIKFRAWDGMRMTTSGIMFNTSTGSLDVPEEASFGGKITNPYKLMQFTERKDGNDKEIYEGDIVQEAGNSSMYGEVVFSNEYLCFGYIHKGIGNKDYITGEFVRGLHSVYIIGNIYEPNQKH